MYFSIWGNLKYLLVNNPLRHKLIPKLSKFIADKTKLKKSYTVIQTGIDMGAYYFLSKYHTWEYLNFYKNPNYL